MAPHKEIKTIPLTKYIQSLQLENTAERERESSDADGVCIALCSYWYKLH